MKACRELGTTWVKIISTFITVVHKPSNILFAPIAIAWRVAKQALEKLEGAFGIVRVENSRGIICTVHMEVEVTYGTRVVWPYANLLATIILKRNFWVLQFESVIGVTEVRNLIEICHGFCCVWSGMELHGDQGGPWPLANSILVPIIYNSNIFFLNIR